MLRLVMIMMLYSLFPTASAVAQLFPGESFSMCDFRCPGDGWPSTPQEVCCHEFTLDVAFCCEYYPELEQTHIEYFENEQAYFTCIQKAFVRQQQC